MPSHFPEGLAPLLLMLAGPAMADAPAPTVGEAGMAARVVDAACIDLASGAGSCDRVLLLRSESLDGMADLLIQSGDDADGLFVARDIATHQSQDGYRARLEAGPEGTLLVHSEWTGHGRYPWFETLTIARHTGAFHVTGYSYSTYDRPSGGDFSCRVDLLSGNWHASALRVDPETGRDMQTWDVSGPGYPDETEVIWWSFREPPAHCDGVMAEWFDAAP